MKHIVLTNNLEDFVFEVGIKKLTVELFKVYLKAFIKVLFEKPPLERHLSPERREEVFNVRMGDPWSHYQQF